MGRKAGSKAGRKMKLGMIVILIVGIPVRRATPKVPQAPRCPRQIF